MDLLAWFFLGLVVVVLAALVFTIETADHSVKEIKNNLPSEEELNKLKKADLVTFAGANGIAVDSKSTKAVIIEEINKSR